MKSDKGRLFRPRVDMLLNYWLAMRTGSEVSPSRVFDAFRDYAGDDDVQAVMALVRQDLENYRDFETTRKALALRRSRSITTSMSCNPA